MFITELQLVPADSNLVINLPLAISKSKFAFSKSFTIGDFQLPLFRIFFRFYLSMKRSAKLFEFL